MVLLMQTCLKIIIQGGILLRTIFRTVAVQFFRGENGIAGEVNFYDFRVTSVLRFRINWIEYEKHSQVKDSGFRFICRTANQRTGS